MFNETVNRLDFNPSVKGHVSVDVMEHGRIVEHAEHDNYVSPFIYGALRKWCNAHFMMLHDETNLISNAYQDFPDTALNSAFMLTDYAGAVNQRERVIHGNILSYGYHQYVSNNANECSFNQDESYRKANSLRFVFDFSTSQGNGTFQSIYSSPSTQNPAYRSLYKLLTSNSNDKITYCDGKCYKVGDGSLRVFSVDDYITYLNGNTLGGESVQVPNITTSSFITGGNHAIWWAYYNKVYCAPVSDLGNPTAYTIDGNVYNIAYSQLRDSIFILSRDDVKEYTTSMSLKKTFPLSVSASNEISALPEENSLVINNRVYDIDDNANSLQSRARWETGNITYNRVFLSDLAFVYGYSTTKTGLYLGTQYFSRARLDKPVTKNSRQTMKITYDFNMPAIDWEN